MSSTILFQQLLVLMALMFTGFFAYKAKLVDDHTNSKLSSLMVWVLNPALMISGVIGKDNPLSNRMILENIIMVFVLYTSMFLIGFIYIFVFRIKGNKSYLYRMEFLFPNVGFMGIPLVKELFGPQYIVLVAFYTLAFNVICYTYGVHLASRLGGKKEPFNPGRLISPGVVTALVSIAIFALHLNVPAPIVSYVDYLGYAAIAFSMLIIGISLAKVDWKTAFAKMEYILFLIADMIVIPLIIVYLSRFLPFDTIIVRIFQIMVCMPVASMTCMFAQEYGGDGTECAKLIAMSTVLTVITAPLVIFIAG